MTNSQDSLLRPPAFWPDTAIVGWHEDDGTMSFSYLEAAEVVFNHWKAHRPDDALVLPMLSLFRHAIELALKDGIRDAASCLRRDGKDEPDLQPPTLDRFLSSTHSLQVLSERLVVDLGKLDLGAGQQIPQDVLDTLEQLHNVDHSGQWFRYATVKTGKNQPLSAARPEQLHFDLVATVSYLREAATILLHGVSGALCVSLGEGRLAC